jgi:GT2 family glycosyltransferase
MSTNASDRISILPSCSIIIPTKDKLELIKPCVESVLLSPYAGDLEILIIDNGSTDPKVLSYLDSLLSDARIKVIRWDRPFNFSEINNMAARLARGDVLCFLNNDIEVKTPEWLQRLAPVANMDEVGAVGALLLYPDNTIQHAGVALDRDWVGLHIAHGTPLQELEQRYQLDRWYSADAVTAACMLTRRELFLSNGGFDAEQLAVSFNDVDYCLRLRKFGYPSVLLPSMQLYHYESRTRKSDDLPENQPRALQEKKVMQARWKEWLKNASYKGEVRWQAADSSVAAHDPAFDSSQIQTIRKCLPLPGTGQAAEPGGDVLMDRLQILETEYRALESHARNLQNQLDLITGSAFWRFTSPIRRIFSLFVRIKQRLGLALVSTEFGRRVYSLKQKSPVELTPTPPDIDVEKLKKDYSDAATNEFSEFMSSGQTLLLPQSDTPKVSILLVLFNQAHLTLLCLKSLAEHIDVQTEIIIVDNNSTDQSQDMMMQIKGATYIRNEDNTGFVHAVNKAASVAKGDYLLLLNNDALLLPGSLKSALSVFETERNVGAVGGRIRLLDGSLQEAGSIIWQDGSCLGYGRGKHPESPEFMFRREVDYCSGAFLMIPRNLFEKLNGLDTDYAPAYYEESDFCIRLKKAGYRIIYEPGAEIIHYEFASSGGYEGASKLQQEHRKILCAKHQDYLSNQYVNTSENLLKARTNVRSKRVLVIDDRVPHANLGAGLPRCREMLHDMSASGLLVTLFPLRVSYDEWDKTYETLPANIEVMLYLGKDKLATFLAERRGFYDYILVSRNHNMEWFNDVIKKDPSLTANARIIYDSEALTAPREASRLRLEGQNISAAKEQKMIEDELELARHADCIVTVSEAESDIYRRASFTNLAVLGHKAISRPTNRTFSERNDFLFVGALRDDKSPNVDSLVWFCNRILPLIRQKLGHSVQLIVVGDNTSPSINRLKSDGVRFMGRQDDITPLYDRCRVFVAPTRFAAGIPHKIHEAAANGIPVVSTTLLATQLSWSHGVQLLAADREEEFAEQCVRLYTDESLWQSVRDKATVSLTKDCSPELFRQRLLELFDS